LFKRPDTLYALHQVSVEVPEGKVMGLVGESGSGKSTLAKAIVGLVNPTRGDILFQGERLPAGARRKRKDPSRRLIQMVFQDPYSSLNNRRRIGDILAEPLIVYGIEPNSAERRRLAASFLELVGLPAASIHRYPHQFSGGQRQRIAVARALIARPDLLICDEPTSALDVSIQAQILNLLKDLQERFSLTILFISHNLAVVRQMSDHIMVLKSGELVEHGDSETFFQSPQHPYSRELLELTPSLDLVSTAGTA
jgi:peptide/nickel transport system ATP-binding protein